MDPKGKVALLTGGARIGQVVAQNLAARGCDLALVYRASRDAAEALMDLGHPNARLCKALIDRITDRATIIETGTESYRFGSTLQKT
jgi:NAD(P)-dependent dehydrogenase (short-subunit alcohol dehydrogenase family)